MSAQDAKVEKKEVKEEVKGLDDGGADEVLKLVCAPTWLIGFMGSWFPDASCGGRYAPSSSRCHKSWRRSHYRKRSP
jgi:hypothetical protein